MEYKTCSHCRRMLCALCGSHTICHRDTSHLAHYPKDLRAFRVAVCLNCGVYVHFKDGLPYLVRQERLPHLHQDLDISPAQSNWIAYGAGLGARDFKAAHDALAAGPTLQEIVERADVDSGDPEEDQKPN